MERTMTRLGRWCGCAALAAALVAAPVYAQERVVQDGIAVRPLSKWRVLQPQGMTEQQSALQYQALLAQAHQQGALLPERHPQVRRVRAIAQRLIDVAPRWNPAARDWKWQVNVLASRTVNAFCMPGGRIAVYTGLIDQLRLSDDEIAAVLGHEIAHALREHGREQAGKATATSLVSRLGGAALSHLLGVDPNVTDQVARAAGQLAVLKFSRDDEREADLIGLDLAARAGYDPRAGVTLWTKMNALNRQQPLELFSTHPGGAERITVMEQQMPALLPVYERARAAQR